MSLELQKACVSGSIEDIKEIFKKGNILLDEPLDHSLSALQYASYFGRSNIVSFLLEFGADVNYKRYDGFNVLMSSACCPYKNYIGALECAKLILKVGNNPSQNQHDGNSALVYAVKNQHVEMVKLFIEHTDQASLSKSFDKALFCASKIGNGLILRILLEKNVEFIRHKRQPPFEVTNSQKYITLLNQLEEVFSEGPREIQSIDSMSSGSVDENFCKGKRLKAPESNDPNLKYENGNSFNQCQALNYPSKLEKISHLELICLISNIENHLRHLVDLARSIRRAICDNPLSLQHGLERFSIEELHLSLDQLLQTIWDFEQKSKILQEHLRKLLSGSSWSMTQENPIRAPSEFRAHRNKKKGLNWKFWALISLLVGTVGVSAPSLYSRYLIKF